MTTSARRLLFWAVAFPAACLIIVVGTAYPNSGAWLMLVLAGLSPPVIAAAAIRAIVARTNRRDDPRCAKRPPAAP
jgi:hypothetical protein